MSADKDNLSYKLADCLASFDTTSQISTKIPRQLFSIGTFNVNLVLNLIPANSGRCRIMSEPFNNPALTERPRFQPAPVIPVRRQTSILDWLEEQGRLIDRDDRDTTQPEFPPDNFADDLMEGDYDNTASDDDDSNNSNDDED
jgi:Protein of unknown function (DUF3134)